MIRYITPILSAIVFLGISITAQASMSCAQCRATVQSCKTLCTKQNYKSIPEFAAVGTSYVINICKSYCDESGKLPSVGTIKKVVEGTPGPGSGLYCYETCAEDGGSYVLNESKK